MTPFTDLIALAFQCWSTPVHPTAVCFDSSLSGFGVCRASDLSLEISEACTIFERKRFNKSSEQNVLRTECWFPEPCCTGEFDEVTAELETPGGVGGTGVGPDDGVCYLRERWNQGRSTTIQQDERNEHTTHQTYKKQPRTTTTVPLSIIVHNHFSMMMNDD